MTGSIIQRRERALTLGPLPTITPRPKRRCPSIFLLPLKFANFSLRLLPCHSMSTAFRIPTLRAPPPLQCTSSLSARSSICPSYGYACSRPFRIGSSLKLSGRLPQRSVSFLPFASQGETTEADLVDESRIEDDDSDSSVGGEGTVSDSISDRDGSDADASPVSVIRASLQSYREALKSNDDSKLAEVETFLKSIEDNKNDLENKVAALSKELSYEKDRILRISADFDNFRKRTERERFSLVGNAQGEVLENLLPVLDNFELAKSQIKLETEGEEKISNSYQSIYKQFVEILSSLGVVVVETDGCLFDPLFHEAIMREESTEFEEGAVIQEFRKGFKLGDRLLRPSMVKVSAGPGPPKAAPAAGSSDEAGGVGPVEQLPETDGIDGEETGVPEAQVS